MLFASQALHVYLLTYMLFASQALHVSYTGSTTPATGAARSSVNEMPR